MIFEVVTNRPVSLESTRLVFVLERQLLPSSFVVKPVVTRSPSHLASELVIKMALVRKA